MNERTILHFDLNSFYASVEQLYHPEFKNLPLAVGGHVEDRHGIILAKNMLAKKYHIHTGETIMEAKTKCPNLVIIPPDFSKYLSFSKKVKSMMKEYTNLVESFGIDEAWMDVTGSRKLFGDGKRIADELRRRVKEELGITASVGVSYNKIFAKLGSDYKKPDATTIISKANKKDIVDPLPIEDLLYVGRATSKKLHAIGIYTIGDLANTKKELLKSLFGKNGIILWEFANGYDYSRVKLIDEEVFVKSVGNSVTTKRDLITKEDIEIVLYVLSESVAARLKEQGWFAKKVAIYWRNNELEGFGKQGILDNESAISKELWKKGMQLLLSTYDFDLPLRSIGIKAFDLIKDDASKQLSLFVDQEKREQQLKLEKTIEAIRNRFGHNSIMRTRMLMDKELSGFNPKREHVIFPQSFFH